MRTLAGFILALCLFAAVSGCYYDNEEELYQYWYEANACDTTNVSFKDEIFPLLQAHCSTPGCHVAGGSGVGLFENYTQVKAKVDDGTLEERVVNRRDMPPGAPLSECNVNLFAAWINAGAPDN